MECIIVKSDSNQITTITDRRRYFPSELAIAKVNVFYIGPVLCNRGRNATAELMTLQFGPSVDLYRALTAATSSEFVALTGNLPSASWNLL